jgi:hypothetical protein
MRDYSKVSPQFWIGTTGKIIRGFGRDAQLVGLYLMTSPHANMLGLYYLPKLFIAHETGLTIEGGQKGLARCIEAHFCSYDKATEMVWVHEMAAYQVGEQLSGGDKRCLGIQNEYDSLPENPFLQAFYDRYVKAFHMSRARVFVPSSGSPSEGPSEPHRSHEHEQEHAQEHEQEQDSREFHLEQKPAERKKRSRQKLEVDDSPIGRVFEHWRSEYRHPKAALDPKRRRAIQRALEAYDEATLCLAISGYKLSPHHMGQNSQRTVYDDISLFLRDAAHIDSGLSFARTPPAAAKSAVEIARDNLRKTVNDSERVVSEQSAGTGENGLGPLVGVLR